jgi:hypothetical protein
MPALNSDRTRVLGDDSVLRTLERVGRQSRTFGSLLAAGFPSGQLDEARQNFILAAETPVERHAGRRMTKGFFDDEDLVTVFCRYYGCTDWRLEGSPLFFAKLDYEKLYHALTSPFEFEANLLDQGHGQERWAHLFLRLPFDLAITRAKATLWDDVRRREQYWHRQVSYRDLRAANLFQYLSRHVQVSEFSRDIFFFNWEREFRRRLDAAMQTFQEALERALRRWLEERNQERRESQFHYGDFGDGPARSLLSVREAMLRLELEWESATLDDVRRAFRRQSMAAHPDQGGSDESFRLLANCREVAENWIRSRLEN